MITGGSTLLHYRLRDKIGEGGMGEVWRAHDETLEREVAIKLLPELVAADPERLARFEREAKVLASLDHPNIARIYGLHAAEGRRFLAMELVPGEDLAERLARGPLPLAEALDAARQVASALEAAHDRGVVHRDLKPANVKRTPDGLVKVLDFGLAKTLEAEGGAPGRTATITSDGTRAGMILGTAAYMSPEQARGLAVDRRTDLWAFGCLLYEMLTGQKAFDGETTTDVLAAVVTRDPDWERLPAGTPSSVKRLLRRCLEKDARKRLRDAGDASLLLDDNPADSAPIPVVAAPVRSRLGLGALAIALLMALVGLGAGWWLAHRPAAEASFGDVAFKRLTFSRGVMRSARFAPDGRTIVYGAAWDGPPIRLYLGRVESADAKPLQLPEAELLSVSANDELAISLGHSYEGWMGEGTLARVGLLGGSPREILEHVRVADWSPTGDLAIVRRVEGFDRLEYPVGRVLYRTAGYLADLRFSPRGDAIAFTDHPVYADDRGDVALVDLAGRKTTLAGGFESVRGLAWAKGGDEVWFNGAMGEGGTNPLRAVDLQGHARVVLPSLGWTELFDIAPDGRVLLGYQQSVRDIHALLAGDTDPRALRIPGETSEMSWIAPDGSAVLLADHLAEGYATYLVRADSTGATRLGHGSNSTLSPDGRWATAVTVDSNALMLNPVGPGTSRTLANPGKLLYETQPAWTPDGKRLVFAGRVPGGTSRGFVQDIESGEQRPFTAEGAVLPTARAFLATPLSPDGRRVALPGTDGTFRIWSLEGGEPAAIPGLEGNEYPLTWTDDGKGLLIAGSGFPIPIYRLDLLTGRRTEETTIDLPDRAGIRLIVLAVTPDGNHWGAGTARLLTDLWVAEGLR